MNIAILGFGIVGKGVYDILSKDFTDHNVKYILELDDQKLGNLISKRPSSYDVILQDDEVDVIIELIGGKGIAYTFIKQALIHKKHVITANKAVISEHYKELTQLAEENNVTLSFEASVGGAIIVLNPLFTIAKINKINKIEGIINGSTNFVLSSVFKENKSLADSIDEANTLGYIETGTTDDMDGLDLLRKINILSMISYKTFIKESDITRVPLSSLTNEFIDYVKKTNRTIKYIATSEKHNNEISIHLEPVILDSSLLYSNIDYEDNIISIHGQYHKVQSFVGQGAGRYPTASAVINDLITIDYKVKSVQEYKETTGINKTKKYDFLVQKNMKFLEVKSITIEELLNDDSIQCFARIGCE